MLKIESRSRHCTTHACVLLLKDLMAVQSPCSDKVTQTNHSTVQNRMEVAGYSYPIKAPGFSLGRGLWKKSISINATAMQHTNTNKKQRSNNKNIRTTLWHSCSCSGHEPDSWDTVPLLTRGALSSEPWTSVTLRSCQTENWNFLDGSCNGNKKVIKK